ncbi:NAD-dependent epimerase/dehydratase family protein [Mycetocola sp. 2940]|uniref:NAD-dependent epimerase/dehydratase family protein n=1 Tax=Mycetocola sp. 2940 TaxID=3156452 RepID=UPI003396C302
MASNTQHVVLGGTGVVGRETAAALSAEHLTVLSVSRSGAPSASGDSRAADLLDAAAVAEALAGATVAYLTVGVPYTVKAWRTQWPVIVKNTIDGCLASGSRLVYFDNVYAYGIPPQPMTESSPIRPCSRKGEVRASLLRMLDAAQEKGLVYTVARSADFYGPGAATSVFNTFVLDRIRDGKEPIWLFDARQPHSMTYTPDIGRALAVLGTDRRAWGRTWHLPTAPALTGEEYIALASGSSRFRTMSATTMRIGALVNGGAREALEMAYQYTRPYLLDSFLFERTFGIAPTPYAEAIRPLALVR